ncbi:MAG: cache domain-containing protein [Candidatus Tenebribacter burtonii]|jgi:methyl-accepting chemotaxis protein|nr:cache domain-containing protein [Candidatus Tenebribacter burtonii]
MIRFKDYPIGIKLSIPFLIIVLLISLLTTIINTHFLNQNFNKEISRNLENKLKVTNDLIKSHSEAALGIASTISEMELVKKAYTEYRRTQNLEKSRNMLIDEFDSISAKLNKESDIPARIHFHVPPARSLLRCWNSAGGDDLSDFRNSILKVSNTQKPVMGIEVGRTGLMIRGISPIFTLNDEFAGSVEFITPFLEIKKHLISKSGKVAFFILKDMTKNIRLFSDNNDQSIKYKGVKYQIIDSNSNSFNLDIVFNYLLSRKITELEMFKKDSYYYAMSPIYNFDNNAVGLVVYQEDISDYIKNRNTLNFLIISLSVLLAIGGIIFILILIHKVITKPLMMINKVSRQHILGDIEHKIEYNSKDEVGLLASSFRKLQKSMLAITNHAKTISSGDYSIEIKLRSEKDELSIALNEMTKSLHKTSRENEIQNWLKTGQNKLSNKMRGDQDIKTLSKTVITFIVKYLKAQIGSVYIVDESKKSLVYTGSYALSKGKDVIRKIKFGEGLVGQAALEKEIITLSDIPDNYIDINSTFGEFVPKTLLIAPFMFENNVLGIMELGSINEFTALEIEFIKSTLENIAIAFNSTLSREQLKMILEKTNKQAEKLKEQQEELRASNEELEEQTEELRASTEKFKTQQEELQAINKELETNNYMNEKRTES